MFQVEGMVSNNNLQVGILGFRLRMKNSINLQYILTQYEPGLQSFTFMF